MNNGSTYWANYGGRYVHMALIGDLSLVENPLPPPSNLNVAIIDSGGRTELSWTASTKAEGYYVYRKQNPWASYERIGASSTTQFTDSCLPDTGTFYYAVRAYASQTSPSGSYRNLSPSSFDTIQNKAVIQVIARYTYQVSDFEVQFTNTSVNATSYQWDFGNGQTSTDHNPIYDFGAPGTYTVILTAKGACGTDSDTTSVHVQPNGSESPITSDVKVYPNPASGWITVALKEPGVIRVLNSLGQEMIPTLDVAQRYQIKTDGWPQGWYLIEIPGTKAYRKVLLQ